MAAVKPPRAPFDDENADVIFRSSDNVDFRIYKVVSAKASPVFRDMFTLPGTLGVAPGQPQIVNLTENARTLEHVFRMCYPVEHPTITSVDDVHAVLEMARKYEMASVIANLRWVIKRILPNEPLRIFAIAYLLEMEDPAREAANLLLDHPEFHIPVPLPLEFSVLPCAAIYSVHMYRKKCAEAAIRALEDRDWILNGDHERNARALSVPAIDNYSSWAWVTCGHKTIGPLISAGFASYNNGGARVCDDCPNAPSEATLYIISRNLCDPLVPRKWWWTFVQSLKTALQERPSGRTVRSHLTDVAACGALKEAASCSVCNSKAYADLSLFSNLLAQRIDRAIDDVQVDLPFATIVRET